MIRQQAPATIAATKTSFLSPSFLLHRSPLSLSLSLSLFLFLFLFLYFSLCISACLRFPSFARQTEPLSRPGRGKGYTLGRGLSGLDNDREIPREDIFFSIVKTICDTCDKVQLTLASRTISARSNAGFPNGGSRSPVISTRV